MLSLGKCPQGLAKFLLCQGLCCIYWSGKGPTIFFPNLLFALMGSKHSSRRLVDYVKPGSSCPGFEEVSLGTSKRWGLGFAWLSVPGKPWHPKGFWHLFWQIISSQNTAIAPACLPDS